MPAQNDSTASCCTKNKDFLRHGQESKMLFEGVIDRVSPNSKTLFDFVTE